MGYNTTYHIRGDKFKTREEVSDFLFYFGEETGLGTYVSLYNSTVTEVPNGFVLSLNLLDVKWPEDYGDMRRFSMEYPDVTFTVAGFGEMTTDVWVAQYVNGERNHARLPFSG